MIIVTLMGGMGNQMFQYAFARALSLRNEVPFKIDLSFLKRRDMGPNFVYRNYDLDLFNVVEDFNIIGRDVDNLLKMGEPHFHYSTTLPYMFDFKKHNVHINGYWQSPRYFYDFDKQIREDFKFKNPIKDSEILTSIRNTNSVMINVRRADYLTTNYHGVMDMTYINSAVDLIKSKVDNPHFFIFSDDIEWCKENIKLDNMTIVDHSYKGDRFGDYLQLMISCNHFIIPNSTFAWWAAWLNENPEKIVIAPKKWFTDSKINTDDLIPQNWIRI